jgi:hypothetical protein
MKFAGRLIHQFQGESIWSLGVLSDVCKKFQQVLTRFAGDEEDAVPVSCNLRFIVVQVVIVVEGPSPVRLAEVTILSEHQCGNL